MFTKKFCCNLNGQENAKRTGRAGNSDGTKRRGKKFTGLLTPACSTGQIGQECESSFLVVVNVAVGLLLSVLPK